MSFKKVMCAALATVLVGAFAASASASDKKMSINLGHVAIETTPIGRGTEYFAQIVSEKTNGRITVSVFPNSQLGGNREMIEQLQMGTLQLCSPSNAFLGGFTEKTALFDLPYLFTSKEGAFKVFDSEVGTAILDDLSDAGIQGLGWFAMGWRNVTCNKEVHTPADMAGLKIRVMENQLHIDHFNQLGCSAIPMSFSEVYTSLQQGVIDAEENPYSQIDTQRFYEVQKYLIETHHIYDPVPLVASKSWWDGLDDEDRAILTECVQEALVYERGLVDEIDGGIKQRFIDENLITVVELTDEERAAFREAVQPVYDKYADKIGTDLIEKAIEIQK